MGWIGNEGDVYPEAGTHTPPDEIEERALKCLDHRLTGSEAVICLMVMKEFALSEQSRRDDRLRGTKYDYIEDFADEDNGDYSHCCSTCDTPFRGHKRRGSICKRCHVYGLENLARSINEQTHPVFADCDAYKAKAEVYEAMLANAAEIKFWDGHYVEQPCSQPEGKQCWHDEDHNLYDTALEYFETLTPPAR